jgi:transcriptional regulator with XRE-family HTH domain
MNRYKTDTQQFGDDTSKESALLARKLGRRIQLLRVEAGLSQLDLAEGLGICREMLARYERGLNFPRLLILLRLCALLAVDPAQLLSDLLPTAVSPLPPGKRKTPQRAAAAARLVSEGVRG